MKSVSIIPPFLFSKDHWSLLAYIECCNVDDGGKMDKRRLRCNPHGPNGIHAVNTRYLGDIWMDGWGTRLKRGKALRQHDDWDCLADLEMAGYVELISAANAIVKLTKVGLAISALLRAHKAAGGQFAIFNPTQTRS